ncbi:MAG: DUF6011 domain-containing protein [Microlunatus sp.]
MTDLQQTAQVLKANLAALPAKDVEFASSLLKQFERKGTLSDKQAYWFQKMADTAQGVSEPPKQQAEKIVVGHLAGIKKMFDFAAKKLKHPRMELQLPSGLQVRLNRVGDKSKNSGCVYVLTKSFDYAGKVDQQGQFFPTKNLPDKVKTELADFLRELSRYPPDIASKQGKLTGRCCFCSSILTDPKSIYAGYGPTCASNFNLPWGIQCN